MSNHDKDIVNCFRCGRGLLPADGFIVDENFVCVGCLYGDAEPFKIYPIGIVHNNIMRDHTDFGAIGKGGVSRIELLSSQRAFLYKLNEEKDLTIVYYLHKLRSVRSVFKRGGGWKNRWCFCFTNT